MLKVTQEENEEQKKATIPPVRLPPPPTPAPATLSQEDEAFLARLRRSESVTEGGHSHTEGEHSRTQSERVLPSLTTPVQQMTPPPATYSLPEWWAHLITSNPIFQKELLSQRRIGEKKQSATRATEKTLGVLGVLGLYAGMFYLISLAMGQPQNVQQGYFWGMHSFLVVIQSLVLMLAMPLQAATTITSEREKMTWNALLLSRNSPLQILAGKAAGTLRPIALFYGAMLPALVITATGTGMAWTNFLASQIVLIVTAFLNLSVSLYCSLTSKKSQQASGNAGGWVIVPLLGLPGLTAITYGAPALVAQLLNTRFDPPSWFPWFAVSPNIFNPITALVATLSTPGGGYPPWLWVFVPTFYLVMASLAIRGLWKRMLATFWQAPKDLSG